jgi:hypothetical protein
MLESKSGYGRGEDVSSWLTGGRGYIRPMRTLLPSLAIVGLLASLGCGTPVEDGWTRPASAPRTSALGALQTRDHKVTFLSGNRLRVEDARGAVVADGVTTDDLEKIDPFLHRACTRATAGAFLDARLSNVNLRGDLF